MAASPPIDDAWTAFALMVFRVNGLIMRAGEDITAPVGQTSARWQVLGRAFEPRTVAGIAAEIGYARQSVQRVADVLAADGLVVYRDHPTDRRTKLLDLTPEGWKVLEAIHDRQSAWSAHVVAELHPRHLTEAAAALGVIADVIEGVTESAHGEQQASTNPQSHPQQKKQK